MDDVERRPDVEALVAEFAKLIPDRFIVNHQTGANIIRIDRALEAHPEARTIVTAALKAKREAALFDCAGPPVGDDDSVVSGLSRNWKSTEAGSVGNSRSATGIRDADMARVVMGKVQVLRLDDSRRRRLAMSVIRSVAAIPDRYRHRPKGTYPLTEAAILASVESREDHAKRMAVVAVMNVTRKDRHIGYRSIWQTYQFPKDLRSVVTTTAKEECARQGLVWELRAIESAAIQLVHSAKIFCKTFLHD